MCAKLDTTGLLADVTYAIFHGDDAADREHCCLYRRADGGYWMTAERDLTWPRPTTLYAEIRAGADWRIESLVVRLSGGLQRDASHRAEGALWRATIQSDEATIERTVPFEPEMQIDFDSIWLEAITLNRLKLVPGQAREVDVIKVELPWLEPAPTRRRYECVGLEHVTTLAGDVDAMHYVVSGAHHVWADSRGIVVATQQMTDRLPHGRKLLEYHWLG